MLITSLQQFVNFRDLGKVLPRIGAFAVLALMVVPVQAQDASISLDLNDDAVRLSGQQIRPARQLSFGGSIFNHQDRGTVVSGDFHITGNAATKARPINVGLGGRLVYTRLDEDFGQPEDGLAQPTIVDLLSVPIPPRIPDQSGYALAVGGFFNGKIPNYDRIGYGGHVYFSPDVLAFGDMEDFTDIWLYGSYSVLRNGDVYVGVRSLKTDFKDFGDLNFDTGMHLGFTLKF